MTQVLDGLQGVVCKIDNILLCAAMKTEQYTHLIVVLECLQQASITLMRLYANFARPVFTSLGTPLTGKAYLQILPGPGTCAYAPTFLECS